ncbi:MAG TPA: C40 family peptidase [Candidatus Deferrimicrobium sp.]|nr:C40 family peptidase [Candidatus Deferrimicrobium sp.]
MHHAWVTTNLLDLRAEPRHDSERLSQLFFREIVTVEKEQDGFSWIAQADGYSGWVDSRFLQRVGGTEEMEKWRTGNAVVIAPTATLYDRLGQETVSPHILYYGTKLNVRFSRGTLSRVIMPGGQAVFIKSRHIAPIKKRGTPVTGTRLVGEGRRFLGVPYLWGGVTVTGFDCSGFVRTVCSRFGVYLPRDTKEQIMAGEAVTRERIRTGDLLFFERHVGFAVGRTHVLHASRGSGGVRLNALTVGLPDYREDLDRDFIQARRVTP